LQAELKQVRATYNYTPDKQVIAFTEETRAPIRTQAVHKMTFSPPTQSLREEPKMFGKKGGCGPAWTRGEIEKPEGIEDMGSWTAAVYSQEQQNRLGVDKNGAAMPVNIEVEPTMVGGKGGCGPAWTRGETEAPAGTQDNGSYESAIYTQE